MTDRGPVARIATGMRRLVEHLPSPATAVAFVALLAALCGTAVALPGSNTVTSGDIANSSVRSGDIANSTVRGRDVRNNSLTGSDVRESSLGTVPRANVADSAGTANTAGAAVFAGAAGTAGTTAGVFRSGQLRASDGDNIPIVTRAGFTLRFRCGVATTLSAGHSEITVENSSGGEDAHFASDGSSSSELDVGDEEYLVFDSSDSSQRSAFTVVGTGGSITGTASVTGHPDDDLAVADCLAHVVFGHS